MYGASSAPGGRVHPLALVVLQAAGVDTAGLRNESRDKLALCIAAGIAIGQAWPGPVQAIGRMEVARVNLPVGVLIGVMIVPMLPKVDFGALHQVKRHWRGISVTLFVNWAVKPFSMALLATLVLLFAFRGEAILRQPLVIAMLAVPILVQVVFNAALATVVGVLVEVPAMLLVVRVVNRSNGWYEAVTRRA